MVHLLAAFEGMLDWLVDWLVDSGLAHSYKTINRQETANCGTLDAPAAYYYPCMCVVLGASWDRAPVSEVCEVASSRLLSQACCCMARCWSNDVDPTYQRGNFAPSLVDAAGGTPPPLTTASLAGAHRTNGEQ